MGTAVLGDTDNEGARTGAADTWFDVPAACLIMRVPELARVSATMARPAAASPIAFLLRDALVPKRPIPMIIL